jgi:hypothetical protein
MNDGVRLMTHVWLPKGQGPGQAILVRNPYVDDGNFKDPSLLRLVTYGCGRPSGMPGPGIFRGRLGALREREAGRAGYAELARGTRLAGRERRIVRGLLLILQSMDIGGSAAFPGQNDVHLCHGDGSEPFCLYGRHVQA